MKAENQNSDRIYLNAIAKYERDLIETYYKRGKTYLKLQEYALAIKDFNTVLKLDPQNTKTYLIRGYTYGEIKQYGREIADYTEAIRLSPRTC